MSKGTETREKILDQAMRLASSAGLSGLTIGTLAEHLAMSKSGLFAHFGSKEDLQLEVLRMASERFGEEVVLPAFKSPRGAPRLKRLLDNWISWAAGIDCPGGCLFIAAATEFDDREGKTRDLLVGSQRQLLDVIAKAVKLSIEVGHFRKDTDADQFAFDAYAIVLGYHHARRLMRDPHAEKRARTGFDRLIDAARLPQ